MSKERARRRAERLAVAEREKAQRARRAARRARWRNRRRRLVPKLPDRRTGRLNRRSRGQRAGIAVLSIVALGAVWLLVGPLGLRLALTALLVAALPALVVLTLDRHNR